MRAKIKEVKQKLRKVVPSRNRGRGYVLWSKAGLGSMPSPATDTLSTSSVHRSVAPGESSFSGGATKRGTNGHGVRMKRHIQRWIPWSVYTHPYPDERWAVTHSR